MSIQYLLNGWFGTALGFQSKKMFNIPTSFSGILSTKFPDSFLDLPGRFLGGGCCGWGEAFETFKPLRQKSTFILIEACS